MHGSLIFEFKFPLLLPLLFQTQRQTFFSSPGPSLEICSESYEQTSIKNILQVHNVNCRGAESSVAVQCYSQIFRARCEIFVETGGVIIHSSSFELQHVVAFLLELLVSKFSL